jgi:hypothetical protein
LSSDFQIFPCVFLLHSFLHNNGMLELVSGLWCVFLALQKLFANSCKKMFLILRKNQTNPKEDTQIFEEEELVAIWRERNCKGGGVGWWRNTNKP